LRLLSAKDVNAAGLVAFFQISEISRRQAFDRAHRAIVAVLAADDAVALGLLGVEVGAVDAVLVNPIGAEHQQPIDVLALLGLGLGDESVLRDALQRELHFLAVLVGDDVAGAGAAGGLVVVVLPVRLALGPQPLRAREVGQRKGG